MSCMSNLMALKASKLLQKNLGTFTNIRLTGQNHG